MENEIKKQVENINNSNEKLLLSDVSDSLDRRKIWKNNDGNGSICCGKHMIISENGLVYECLKCGAWEYSSS